MDNLGVMCTWSGRGEALRALPLRLGLQGSILSQDDARGPWGAKAIQGTLPLQYGCGYGAEVGFLWVRLGDRALLWRAGGLIEGEGSLTGGSLLFFPGQSSSGLSLREALGPGRAWRLCRVHLCKEFCSHPLLPGHGVVGSHFLWSLRTEPLGTVILTGSPSPQVVLVSTRHKQKSCLKPPTWLAFSGLRWRDPILGLNHLGDH
jgi:hypothetical protein